MDDSRFFVRHNVSDKKVSLHFKSTEWIKENSQSNPSKNVFDNQR